jgi:hypothetical protein
LEFVWEVECHRMSYFKIMRKEDIKLVQLVFFSFLSWSKRFEEPKFQPPSFSGGGCKSGTNLCERHRQRRVTVGNFFRSNHVFSSKVQKIKISDFFFILLENKLKKINLVGNITRKSQNIKNRFLAN